MAQGGWDALDMTALTSAGRKTGTCGGVCGRLWQGRTASLPQASTTPSRLSCTASTSRTLRAPKGAPSSTVPTRHHCPPPCRTFSMVSFSFRASLHSKLAATVRHSSTDAAAPTTLANHHFNSTHLTSPQLNSTICALSPRGRSTPEPPVLTPAAAHLALLRHASALD